MKPQKNIKMKKLSRNSESQLLEQREELLQMLMENGLQTLDLLKKLESACGSSYDLRSDVYYILRDQEFLLNKIVGLRESHGR